MSAFLSPPRVCAKILAKDVRGSETVPPLPPCPKRRQSSMVADSMTLLHGLQAARQGFTSADVRRKLVADLLTFV
jgi:hypothetical protein